jgi:hypothetical protein
VGRGYPPFVKAQPGDDGTTAENGIRPGQISAADSLLSDRIKRLRTVPGVGPITALTSGGRIQISNQGGAQARWRGDGKELFYISGDKKLMAVSIDTSHGKLFYRHEDELEDCVQFHRTSRHHSDGVVQSRGTSY